MKKNVCIIHYNTPFATECLVKSINRQVKDAHIYIFDNSDSKPFINNFDNVHVFDNTNGEYINFTEIIKQYRPDYKKKTNFEFASFEHCISVQKCMELINENFVLMDSDILIKRDFSELYQEDKICVGYRQIWADRICPILCFINVDLCKKYNVSYYNDNIFGINNVENKTIDTGTYFTEKITNLPHIHNANIEHFMVHYSGASRGLIHKLTLERWLYKYKKLWDDNLSVRRNFYIK